MSYKIWLQSGTNSLCTFIAKVNETGRERSCTHNMRYVNKQNCRIWWAQKTSTHTLKSQGNQNESLFDADFGPEPLGHFSSKMSKERLLQSIGFLFTKIKEEAHLVSTGKRYIPHSRSYTRCFAPYIFEDRIISTLDLFYYLFIWDGMECMQTR